ncbi:MAG: hypothetical protein Q3960_02810 [Lactobacillus sp.]|nr:hypothetical protein [Lactobacillus sp.]
MTEENKVQNEAEESAVDKFEVSMPEAERVVMAPEEKKEQPAYLKSFASFYIAHYIERDLEVINLYDKKHNMVDINQYLINNIEIPRHHLIDRVLHRHDYNFLSIIDEIKKESKIDPTSLQTVQEWEDWYEKRRAEIPGSLS